jgi:hypothetical protein
MERQRTLPSIKDIYAAYGEALPSREQEGRVEWQVPVGLGEELEERMVALAQDYVPRVYPKREYVPKHLDEGHDDFPLFKGPLTCDPSIQCIIHEIAGISSMVTQEKKQWALWFTLKKDGKIVADTFILHGGIPKQDEELPKHYSWNFSHRLIPKAFRAKGLFHMMAHALEAFVQQRAILEGRTHRMFVNTGQPDVVVAFDKREYLPATPQDAATLDLMVHPNGLLKLHYARKPQLFADDTEGPIPEDATSMYCFKAKNIEDKSNLDAFLVSNAERVTMEKLFMPKEVLPELQKDVHEKAQQTLRTEYNS